MNLDETPRELAARTRMAQAMQQLGHALIGHRIDVELAGRVADAAEQLAHEARTGPARDRASEMASSPRLAGLVEGGPLGPADGDGDGERIDFFRDSIVSGRTNPMGIGVDVRRHGDAAVAITTLGPAFEGAPGRAHGGILAAIIDEAMGCVLPIVGEIAYTANLNIDYIAPAPIGRELRVTARLRDRSGRKLWIEAHGTADGDIFVRAEALFLAVDLAMFANGTGDPG